MFTQHFFFQGEAADELLELLDREGAESVVDYLLDAGCEDGEEYKWEPWGTSDDVESVIRGDVEYFVSSNSGLNYIGLQSRKVK